MIASSDYLSNFKRPVPIRPAVRKTAPSCKIRRLDMNSMLEVLSFLDQSDLARCGATSKEMAAFSQHPSLWKHINISDVRSLDVPGLSRLIMNTTAKLPLNSISLTGPETTGCYCRESTVCKNCSEVSRCQSASTCSTCECLVPIKPKLAKFKSFTIHNVRFLTSCPFNTMLQSCSALMKLDIMNDLDVNIVVSALAANCPLLTDIRFKYPHALDFDAGFRQSHPLLRPQVAEAFVASCSRVKHISFCHYAVDEDCARCLLELEHVVEADFSDNENLSGAFLVELPTKWANLRRLVMRDCTELDNDYVQNFASMLLQSYGGQLRYCRDLRVADFSCQWAFHGDSFVGEGTHRALPVVRPSFRWREDQCEVPGFGIDPDSGIDGIEDEDELHEFSLQDTSGYSDGDGDLAHPRAALDEALGNVQHSSPTKQLALSSR